MLQKYWTFGHVLTIMFRMGGELRFNQKKKKLPWTFRDLFNRKLAIFVLLGDFEYSFFNHSSKQSSCKKMFPL